VTTGAAMFSHIFLNSIGGALTFDYIKKKSLYTKNVVIYKNVVPKKYSLRSKL
jgi:hypothetical protein